MTAVNLFVNRMMSALHPSLTLVMNGCSLLIVWIGSKHVAASSLEVGQMMAYLQYAMHVIMSFLMISMMFIMIPRAAVSAKRISEVLAVDPSITDPEKPEALEASAGSVEFRGVSFKYEGAEEDALCDVSFSMSPGETVALVGPTGAGKSTLARFPVLRRIGRSGVSRRKGCSCSVPGRIAFPNRILPSKGGAFFRFDSG